MKLKLNSEQKQYEDRFLFYFLSGISGWGAVSILNAYNTLDRLSDILELSGKELDDLDFLSDSQRKALINEKRNVEIKLKEYDYLLKSEIKYITYPDSEYPERLRNIPQPPAILFVKGELPDDNCHTVGIIGSRAATNYGISSAEYMAEVLADAGIGIISGLARGIDGAAHRGALNSLTGNTYAVLGGGVNIIYPKESEDIYKKITENNRGGIISEMLPGTNAVSQNFPMRNRILSGLSDVIIVIEAREQSGSLITVDIALEQGKDIMAVPGRITDPMSKGCNRLINNGARMANSPEDVLELLNIKPVKKDDVRKKMHFTLAKNEKIVYSTLDSAPKHLEEIVFQTGLPLSEVIGILLELELKGMAVQISSDYYGLSVRNTGMGID